MDLSTLLASGGIKSVQTGFVDSDAPTSGSAGEDRIYVDVTIAAVDVTKAVAWVDGGYGIVSSSLSYSVAGAAAVKSFAPGSSPAGAASYGLTCRLINATTLRISAHNPQTTNITSQRLAARWTVAEAK